MSTKKELQEIASTWPLSLKAKENGQAVLTSPVRMCHGFWSHITIQTLWTVKFLPSSWFCFTRTYQHTIGRQLTPTSHRPPIQPPELRPASQIST